MTSSRRSFYTWAAFATLYVALTVVYFWPVLNSITSMLPSDPGDPALNAWIVWWNAQAIPFTERWWNAPIFFPVKGAFALSETLVSMAPLTTPLQWAGASAVTAYNVAFIVAFPLTALSAHALARRLTGRHDAALLAGLASAFNAYRASQLPHIQMQWELWMPLCLFALHRYLDTRRRRNLVLAGVCWLFNGLTSGYFLVYFAVLTGLWMCWFVRTRRDWLAISATLALASLLLAPALIGYQRHQAALGLSRDTGEIEEFSADLSAIWATSSAVWVPNHWTIQPRAEGELYPGVTIMLLTLVGAVVAWRRARSQKQSLVQIVIQSAGGLLLLTTLVAFATGGGWRTRLLGLQISLTRLPKALFVSTCLLAVAALIDHRTRPAWRRRSILIFYVAASVAMFTFALGPIGHAFGQKFFFHAPYSWLMALPGGHSLRVPARFGALFALCLAQAAAIAFSRLTPRRARVPLVAALALAIALDGWAIPLPTAPVPPGNVLSAGLVPNAAVLELPMRDLYTDAAAMLRATVHRYPLVNGFSGYAPPHYGLLVDGLNAHDPSMFTALRQVGPLIVVVVRANDPDGIEADFVRHVPEAQLLFQSPLGPVYSMAALSPSTRTGAVQLAPSTIGSSQNPGNLHLLADGNVHTLWGTSGPQTPGDEITIAFDRPVTLSRIEMDLGAAMMDFPRRLRVTVSDGPAAPAVVFESSTSGPAVLAALADHARMPLVIDLTPSAPGRLYTMTLTEPAKGNGWSIAELRVFGRAE